MDIKERTNLIWEDIQNVHPNPLNPRKDSGMKTEKMQDILQKRGWEEGITAYKNKDGSYTILSGHRRLHAAKAIDFKQVPIYVVEKPDTPQEEVERIASLQSAHEEWTKYEWAKFAYDSWIYWEKPAFTKFSKIIHMNAETLETYINTFEFYDRRLLEKHLSTNQLTFYFFHSLRRWLYRFEEYQGELYNRLGKEMLIETMVNKAVSGRITDSNKLYNDDFIRVATKKEVMEFLNSPKMSLADAQNALGIETSGHAGFNRKVEQRIGHIIRELPHTNPKDKKEKEYLKECITDLKKSLGQAKRRIAKYEKERA